MRVILFLLLPLGLHAQVKYVDDSNLSPTHNGSSQYPYSSIQTAIVNAINHDSVKVAAGTYGNIDNLGKSLTIMGGYEGGTGSSYNAGTGGDFITRTANPAITIISGGIGSIGVNLTRFNDDPFDLVFDNFTVMDSRKGVVCDAETSWPPVENVTVSNNIVENNGQAGVSTTGGGVLVTGNNNKILNNIIRNNRGGRGAGIARNGNAPEGLLMEGNLVENNTGYDDHCAGVYLDGEVTIRHNVISGNRLENSYGWGGGVLILGTAHMSYNVIKDNYCPSYGAAVFVDEGATAYIDNELVYGNTTLSDKGGAAIGVDDGDPGPSNLYLTNSTIVNNNSSGADGGNAVYLDNGSFATVTNCITYGNGNGDDFYIRSGSNLTVSYTLSEEAITGIGNITGNPLLKDALNHDFHLLANSPCIDAGINASVVGNADLDGNVRIFDGGSGHGAIVDMGVYEFNSTPTSIMPLVQNGPVINIFPNPAKKLLNIGSDIKFTKYALVNIAGQVICQNPINGNQIDLKNLPKGIYQLILITTDNKKFNKQVIME